MPNISTVKDFLQELKQIIKIWDIFFIDKPKNSIQELADLEITSSLRTEIISQLEVEDYCKGPDPETQYNGKELWVFGKIINEQEIYIKLTISKTTGKTICISFHKAEHPLKFPLKNNKK